MLGYLTILTSEVVHGSGLCIEELDLEFILSCPFIIVPLVVTSGPLTGEDHGEGCDPFVTADPGVGDEDIDDDVSAVVGRTVPELPPPAIVVDDVGNFLDGDSAFNFIFLFIFLINIRYNESGMDWSRKQRQMGRRKNG